MSFRVWLETLREARGKRPLWPVLLGVALDAEFRRQREIDECYKGEVFKNPDKHELAVPSGLSPCHQTGTPRDEESSFPPRFISRCCFSRLASVLFGLRKSGSKFGMLGISSD